MNKALTSVANAFGLSAQAAVELGGGIINSTYILTQSGARYVLQRMNSSVFGDCRAVVQNQFLLCDYYRRRHCEADERSFLTPVRTTDGAVCHENNGEVWRCNLFIENSCSPDCMSDLPIIREMGRAIAQFEKAFTDFPKQSLTSVFKCFHAPLERFQQMQAAFSATDGDAGRVRATYESLCSFLPMAAELLAAHENDMPRIVHYDTKPSNILFDKDSYVPLCLIDLDTVCTGLAMYDYGDAARELLVKRHRATHIYDFDSVLALLDGYMSVAAEFVSPDEQNRLFDGLFLITFELCTRFITDYLEGEVYFKTEYAGQCADRANEQLLLLKEVSRFSKTWQNRLGK